MHPAEPARGTPGRLLAVDQGEPEPGQRGQQRDLEAAEEELRGEESSHGREKIAAGHADDSVPPPETIPKPALPLFFRSDGRFRHPHRQRPPAQPAGHHGRPPHRALIVVTGPSGSGKSTLAFDTLYAEGQRRYIESLSTYAKQFLERMPKPLVDRLEGLAPAVAIEQRNPDRFQPLDRRHGDRGLRLPPPAVGPDRPEPTAAICGAPVRRGHARSRRPTPSLASGVAARLQIAFPLPPIARAGARGRGGEPARARLRPRDRRRRPHHLDELPRSARPHQGARAARRGGPTGSRRRRRSARICARRSAPPSSEGEGVALVLHDGGRLRFTEFPACSACDTPAAVPSPRRSSPSTTRAAPAPPAMGSARCWSTTSR